MTRQRDCPTIKSVVDWGPQQPDVTHLMLPKGVVKIGTRVKSASKGALCFKHPLKTDGRELRFLQRRAAQSLIDYSGAR